MLNGNGVMTLVRVFQGKVVMREGKVATHQACCCGCTCPECNENVSIELNAGPSSSDGCTGVLQFQQTPSYEASQLTDDPDNTHGGIVASMHCEPDAESPHGIIWRVSAVSTFANFGDPDAPSFGLFCTKTYSGTTQSDGNCLPVAGSVELTLDTTEDGGACDRVTTPTVTVVRA